MNDPSGQAVARVSSLEAGVLFVARREAQRLAGTEWVFFESIEGGSRRVTALRARAGDMVSAQSFGSWEFAAWFMASWRAEQVARAARLVLS